MNIDLELCENLVKLAVKSFETEIQRILHIADPTGGHNLEEWHLALSS